MIGAAARVLHSENMATEPTQPRPARRTSLRDEQKRMTRERLVAASYEVFAKSGYTATAIQDITDAADVNRSTFYQHFAGKPEIFLATAEYRIGLTALRYWKTLDAALMTGTKASIRTWLLEAARWWSDNAAFVAASTEATSVEPTLRASQSVL